MRRLVYGWLRMRVRRAALRPNGLRVDADPDALGDGRRSCA